MKEKEGPTPRLPSTRPASLLQTPSEWRPIGRAQLGSSVPRPLPRLPVVVGEGVGRPVATAAGGLGLVASPAPVGVGAPTGPLQALNAAVARGLPPPRIVLVRQGPRKFCQGYPPLLRGVQLGGAMGGLVAQVGAPWIDMLARMGACCVVVPLRKFCQGSPPLLRGVQEGWALWGCWPGWALTKSI